MKGAAYSLLNKKGERRPIAPASKAAQSSTEERAGLIVCAGWGVRGIRHAKRDGVGEGNQGGQLGASGGGSGDK